MSDKELGKKIVEKEDLDYFLHAYELVTGEELSSRPHERPDFICERPTGEEVGIEKP